MARSKTVRAIALAGALVLAANAWVSARLPSLVPESSIDNLLELERRVEAAPHKERVKLLVFGNSHAVAGLRPALVAEAFHVAPDEAFSFAMPGASPREMRLLADRYLDRFPAATVALCGVEEYFLSANIDTRLRYMTRFDPVERWNYARRFTSADTRVGLMAGALFPIADFSVPLREALLADPLLAARRLATDVSVPSSIQSRLASARYPMGFPPPWDEPDVAAMMTMKWDVPTRAWHLVSGADAIPDGLEQLDALADHLEARGIRLTLTDTPYEAPLASELARIPSYQAAYRERLARYEKATGRRVLPAPTGLTDDYFYDVDHLNPKGASRMADWLKTELNAPSSPRPTAGGAL